MLKTSVAIAIATILATQAQAVTNPDFGNPQSSGYPSDWTVQTAVGEEGLVYSVVGIDASTLFDCSPHATCLAASTFVLPNVSRVSQDIPTVAGATYSIEFDIASISTNTDSSVTVTFGGVQAVSTSNTSFPSWKHLSGTALATSDLTTLMFNVQTPPGWYYLSNVSVTAVPEPASYALLAGGMAALAMLRRKLIRR